MVDSDGAIVVTGQGIEIARYLAIAHRLAIEINTGLKFRTSSMDIAKSVCGSEKRTKKGVLRDYVKWLREWLGTNCPNAPTYEPSESIAKAMA